jgi:hypothetical protein
MVLLTNPSADFQRQATLRVLKLSRLICVSGEYFVERKSLP